LKNSLKAAFAGFLATIIFMIIFYRFAGFIAALSLIIYAALYVMILKIWPTGFGGPIVLSLSGAAGVALSIGLAVDGNILIFERMKEELRKGRSLVQAVDLGFERAWMAIRDSNLTTLMICIILSVLGSSIIKGFAITLIVGTLLSMFTAITVSRNLIRFFLLFKVFKKTWLFGVKKSEIGKKVAGAKIRTRKKKKTAK
jgi:preprotein translocase subunit SecD